MDAIKAARKTWKKYSRYHEERRNRLYGYGILAEFILAVILAAAIITFCIKVTN